MNRIVGRVLLICLACLLAFLMTGLLASCRQEPAPLLDYDYSGWTKLNGEPITEPIPGHSSGVRTIYVNETGREVTVSNESGRKSWDYPEGTVIIKEVALPAETAAAGEASTLLGMIKDTGHPRAQGNWVWVMRNARTGEESIFDTEFCITCHADANERRTADAMEPVGVPNPDRDFRDYVFYPYAPEE